MLDATGEEGVGALITKAKIWAFLPLDRETSEINVFNERPRGQFLHIS
jgi:hypothetical protein